MTLFDLPDPPDPRDTRRLRRSTPPEASSPTPLPTPPLSTPPQLATPLPPAPPGKPVRQGPSAVPDPPPAPPPPAPRHGARGAGSAGAVADVAKATDSQTIGAQTIGGGRAEVAIEVIRSAKRRKTVSASIREGVLRISIPARLSKTEEQRWVTEMLRRFSRRAETGAIDLPRRAAELGRRYELPQPATISWVDNQHARWGSCTPVDRTVRVSSRVAAYPAWVLDAVIVHELAHLVVDGHNRDFWALANRYPLTERARGFLIAKSIADPGGDEPQPRLA